MRSLTDIVENYNNIGFENLPTDEQVIISEMATIGWFQETKPNGPEYKVFVNGDEGRIPHMHIWDTATNGSQFHTCVMLEKPQYFRHGGKMSKLSKKEITALIDFLQEYDEDFDVPRWKLIIKQWNRQNKNQKQLTGLEEMPNYLKLLDE